MNANQLSATRGFYARRGKGGLYRFIQNCLEGVFGDDAQSAAAGALVDCLNRDAEPDDRTVSQAIVRAVKSAEEGPDTADVRRGGTR